MVLAGNKAKRLSSVNHTTKTIHHLQFNSSIHLFKFDSSEIQQFLKFWSMPGKVSIEDCSFKFFQEKKF